MKNVIFNLFLLISFQSISHAMETTDKAREVRQFFLNLGVDKNNKKADNAIAYFNKPESGIPIYIKKDLSKKLQPLSPIRKFLKTLEQTVLGYSLTQWKNAWHFEKLRRNNCYDFNKKRYPEDKIDKNATDIAETSLRKNLNIDKRIDIPILKKDFCYTSFSYVTWDNDSYVYTSPDDKLRCHITTNPWLNEKFPNSLPFGLAHEYAHVERGFWTPYRNLLMTKIILASAGLLLSHALFKDCNPYARPILCGLATLGGTILGNLFKGYFNRKEEKACDEFAIELLGSDAGIEESLCLDAEIITHDEFSGNNWAIRELNINKLKTPLEYTTWKEKLFDYYPSPAQRWRDCKFYAENRGYHLPPASA